MSKLKLPTKILFEMIDSFWFAWWDAGAYEPVYRNELSYAKRHLRVGGGFGGGGNGGGCGTFDAI